jgi:hypothetical protein
MHRPRINQPPRRRLVTGALLLWIGLAGASPVEIVTVELTIAGEQPFTLPPGTRMLYVEAHDNRDRGHDAALPVDTAREHGLGYRVHRR